MRDRQNAVEGARRRAVLALGMGAASVVLPGAAQAAGVRAHRVPLTHDAGPDPAVRLVQAPPELRMKIPVFDQENAALIRALVNAPAFRRAMTETAGAPPPAVETGVAPNVPVLQQIRDRFFRLSDPTLTVDERNALLPDDDLPLLFEDVALNDGPPAVVAQGRDVVDLLAYWLMVTFDHTRAHAPANLTGADVFPALRAQVLQGYAGEPRLAGLSPASRHDLAAWVCLNSVYTHLKAEFALRANSTNAPSAAEAAIWSDMQAALRDFGLDPAGLDLGRQGLRRRA